MILAKARGVASRPLGLTFGTSAGIQALNVVSGVLLARTLGVHGRGELAAAILLPMLLAVLGGVGLSEAATYHMARGTSTAGALIGTVLVLTAVQSALLVAIGAALVPLFLSNYNEGIVRDSLLFLIYIPLYLFAFNLSGVLNGMQRFGRSNTLRVLVTLITVIGLVGLAVAHSLSVENAVTVYLLANVINAAVAWIMVSRVNRTPLSFDWQLCRNLLAYGLKTHTSSVSVLVNERIDQLAISIFLGPAKLGLYVIAVTLTSATALIGSSVGMVSLPTVAHLKAGADRNRAVRNFVGLTFFLATLTSAGLIIFVPDLITLFFGQAFSGAADVCRVLLVAAIFFSTNRVIGNVLKAVNRPLEAGIAEVMAILATVGGLAALLPHFGILGAGIASLAAYVVATMWMAYRAGRALGVSPVRLFIPGRDGLARVWRVHAQPRLNVVRSWNRYLFLAACGLVTAGAIGLLVVEVGRYEWFIFSLLVSGLVVTTIGALVLNSRASGDALSLLALIAGYYLITFAFGSVYYWIEPGEFYATRFTHASLTDAVAFATLGWMATLTGYVLNPLKVISQALPPLPRVNTGSPVSVVVALNIIGWPARLALIAMGRYFHGIPIAGGVQAESTGSSWFITMLALLPTLGLALLGAHVIKGAQRTRQRKAFWALLCLEAAWYLPTGERGHIVGLAMVLLVIRYYSSGRKMPWRTGLLAGAVLVFFVMPFGLAYRGNNRTYQLNPGPELREAFQQTTRTLKAGPGSVLDTGFTAAFARFADVASLALIAERGRGEMGLRPGETFVWSAEVFVPRALDRTKTDPGTFGNRFGRAYGIVNSDVLITSIAASQVGEFYLNFGLLGILLGMPIAGAIYRLINDYLRSRVDNPFVLALYALAAWPFVSGLETIVALGIVGVIKTLIFLGLILFGVGKVLATPPLRRERSQAVRALG